MAVRSLLSWLVVFVVASAVSGAASGAEHPAPGHARAPFVGAPIIGNLELVQMRGGFATAFGLEIEFGVLARTLVDGQTVLRSVVSFSDDDGLPITSAALSSIEGVLPGFSIMAEQDAEAGVAEASPPTIDVSAFVNGSGVVFQSAQGIVAGLARVASGQVFNLIASAGMNQQIDQELNLIFSVTGFSRFQQDARTAMAASRLMDSLAPH